MDLHDSAYAVGCTDNPFSCEQDLAISEDFFQKSEFESDEYILELQATNGQNAKGNFSNVKLVIFPLQLYRDNTTEVFYEQGPNKRSLQPYFE